MIHEDKSSALSCCPNQIREIADDKVVYCWRCKGWCCSSCGQQGIMPAWQVAQRDALRSLMVDPAS